MTALVVQCASHTSEKSAEQLVCSAAKNDSLIGIQADLSVTPLFHNALWLLVPFRVYIFTPGAFLAAFVIIDEGYWHDVGTIAEYDKLNRAAAIR